jgi:AraC-like DNA-binding protein
VQPPKELPFTFSGGDVWLSEFRLVPNHPRWGMSAATTDEVALIAFPRTTVAIAHEGRSEVIADPLSAVVYSPRQAYRRRAITEVGDDCTVLAVAPALAGDIARRFDARASDLAGYRFPFVAAAIGRPAYAAVQELRYVVSRAGQSSSDAVREELYRLLEHVVESGYVQLGSDTRSARLATRRAHLEVAVGVRERLGQDLGANETLDELARTALVSPFHLAHIFRRATGKPIHAYRTELRLRASLAPIADGVRLADVAQQLGFASHAHLTARFSRAFGISPVQWRRRLHGAHQTSRNLEATGARSLIA